MVGVCEYGLDQTNIDKSNVHMLTPHIANAVLIAFESWVSSNNLLLIVYISRNIRGAYIPIA